MTNLVFEYFVYGHLRHKDHLTNKTAFPISSDLKVVHCSSISPYKNTLSRNVHYFSNICHQL